MMMMRSLVVGLVFAAACARPVPAIPAGGEGAPAGAGDARVVGIVSVVGSAPMDVHVAVRPDAGQSVYVTGPLAAEVRNLAGARVDVRGKQGRGSIEAADYDVVSVDGRPVIAGTLERGSDGALMLRRRDGSLLRLQAAPATFAPGMKVWVQGTTPGMVQTFGVMRGTS
ncbi:MAG TPA: hypothetical protein VF625_03050 [Longimicrobium sp.]|jgi:hypothetical protein